MTDVLEVPTPAAAPGTYPVPAGRGRWRLTLHNRTYSDTPVSATVIAELSEARGRKLVQAWDSAATLTFTLDGWRPAARYIAELGTEVVARRWDDTTGADVACFRGPVIATEDTIDEQSHTLTVTCTDYLGLLSRRIFTTVTAAPVTYDQDVVAGLIVGAGANGAGSSAGVVFSPGNYLPLTYSSVAGGTYVAPVNPDGSARALSGVSRTFTFQGNSVCLTMLDDAAHVAGGFDYDIKPLAGPGVTGMGDCDALRLFYPRQGVVRTSPALYYPGNVTALKRAVTSADYTNYWRTLGNNQTATQNAAQTYGEAWTPDAQNGQAGAVGLWMTGDASADTADPTLLGQEAQGQLNIYSVLTPTYTLTLAPGFYYQGAFNMGDTLPLYVQSGRLNVNTTLRIVGITYEATDDGTELVTLTVGRDPTSVADMLGAMQADIRALSRR